MKIAILTGAGISKESGIPTFRDVDGLWNQFNVVELASAEALKTNKETVLSFYNMRKEEVKKCEPNAAHLALTELQKHHEVCILTKVNRWLPSSKTCSQCGCIKDQLLLSERLYNCSDCGNVLDRDLNASINIKKWGIDLNTAGTAGICDCGKSSNGSDVMTSDSYDLLKQ